MLMSWGEGTFAHLRDLRGRLLRVAGLAFLGMVVLYVFRVEVLAWLLAPLLEGPYAPRLVMTTSVSDLFFLYMKVCAWGGVFVAVPYLLWELWQFLRPGLYPQERGHLWPALVAVPALFYAGGVVALWGLVPAALKFFLGFEQPGVVPQPNLSEYLSFVFTTMFAFGAAFNFPVFLLIFVFLGLLTPEGMAANRRFVIVGIFAVSVFLTPPDPVSLCVLAVPVCLLYEGAIFWAKRMVKNRHSR